MNVFTKRLLQQGVLVSIYANLYEQNKAFTEEKSSIPSGLSWYTNMAAVSLFWNTNMAAMSSCEYALIDLLLAKGITDRLRLRPQEIWVRDYLQT